ncbi:MAG: SGNH/GDSL hydrolase family protein [Nitrospinae bacterium]|nr:SGNH/GDSL hydrolase family protein [Nitrospinota bacterium]
MKNVLTGLTLLLVSLILTAVAGEGILRVLNGDSGKLIDKKWFDEFVTYNAQGHRDHLHEITKDRDKFRILVLGDSMTMGSGIEKMENTYPKKLEAYLNKGLDQPRFEIINSARPGWNTDTQLLDLYLNGFNFQPDMVFLAYYHNDIPTPDFLECGTTEVEQVFNNSGLDPLLKNSRLYKLIKLRSIRLEEKIKGSSYFTGCINKTYNSLGWEMEKVYLDMITRALKIRNIKFMIGVLPLMHQLEKNYPVQIVHDKMKQYCKERAVDCIDFYDETFAGKDESGIVFSDQDRHINARGAEMVAQALFKKLAPLREYERLPLFHRVFTLNEILSKNPMALSMDQSMDEMVDEAKPFVYSKNFPLDENNLLSLKAWKAGDNYQIEKVAVSTDLKVKRSVMALTLDNKGGFLKGTYETYDPQTQEIDYKDHLEFKENLFHHTQTTASQGKQRTFNFTYKYNGFEDDAGVHLYIDKGYPFESPKTLLTALVSIPKSEKDPELEKAIYNRFLFFYRYNWVTFIESLFDNVLQLKPAPLVVRAIARAYSETGNMKKYKKLLERFPKYFASPAIVENVQ